MPATERRWELPGLIAIKEDVDRLGVSAGYRNTDADKCGKHERPAKQIAIHDGPAWPMLPTTLHIAGRSKEILPQSR